jgi:predicted transcriptional regulator
MSRPPKPTASELELLRVLWELGPATAKEVHAAVEREMSAATVLRLLQIMHGKGLVLRDEQTRSHVYRPAQEKDTLQKGLLGELIQKVFSGSGKELVLAALRDGHVSPEERAEIQAFLHGGPVGATEDQENGLRNHPRRAVSEAVESASKGGRS